MCSLLYDRQSCSPWFDGSLHINSIESVCISLRHTRAVIYLNKIYSSLQIFLTEDCVCAIISSIMPGLSRFSDEEIIRMKRLHFIEGKSYSSLAQIINRDRSSDRLCTSRGVRACLKRASGASFMSKRIYKRKLGFAELAFIDAEVNADREISGRELQKRLQDKLHANVSISVINRERRRMGWIQTSTRYCQMIRAENKEKRLFFCTEILVQKEEFNDCILTDESTVRCERFLAKQFRRLGEPSMAKPKHPLSVHVWAGISKNGTTDIAIFTGIMDSDGYQTIMKDYLLPFVSRAYPQGHRLVMDNNVLRSQT